MSIHISKKDTNLIEIKTIDKLKQNISFIRYFLYIFLPYLGGIFLPALLQEPIPLSEQEVMISVVIFFSTQVIIFSMVLREFLINYDYKSILVISGVLSIVVTMIFNYVQLPLDYTLIGQCIGFIFASICGIIIAQWDNLAYQEQKFSNLKYTIIENGEFFIATKGIFIITFQGYCSLIIRNIPSSSLQLLSSILLEFECYFEEEIDKIILNYTPLHRCLFFQKREIKTKMIEHYQTFVNELKIINILN